jgi:hypothetical protein
MRLHDNRAEGRRSHRGIVFPCGSGLQTAILFPINRAGGRRSCYSIKPRIRLT